MKWNDEGIVLSARKHGEGSAIVTLLTLEHGRHAGLVRGGAGKRARGLYQPGNKVSATWNARLEEHLGTYVCEMVEANAAAMLHDPERLAGLSAICAVAESALPERESHPAMYEGLDKFILSLQTGGSDHWLKDYVEWELALLRELGFGLDLSACAATGDTDQLDFVSPKSARAVSRAAGDPYKDKLLLLPAFLTDTPKSSTSDLPPSRDEVADGLILTGYFLDRHVHVHNRNGAPNARTRFVDRLRQ